MYREKVITALAAAPKVPSQLARETDLRTTHVSRSLREMAKRDLVVCLNPSARSHGRMYGLTPVGTRLAAYMRASAQGRASVRKDSRGIGFVPKVRAATVVRLIESLTATHGREAVTNALEDWSVNPDALTEDTWLVAGAFDEFLELVAARLGNGSDDFIRTLCARVMPTTPWIQEHLTRLVPLSALVERAPIAYYKELNYGRLVVKLGRREAKFQHYDLAPVPAFCAAVHGTYEGILRARRVEGTVTKTRCLRSGDDRCEYLVRW